MKYKVTHTKDNSTGYWEFTDTCIAEYTRIVFCDGNGEPVDTTVVKNNKVQKILKQAEQDGLIMELIQ